MRDDDQIRIQPGGGLPPEDEVPQRGEGIQPPDRVVQALGLAQRWRAALWFWASVAFTTGLGLWWFAMSRDSWPHH